MSKIRLVVCDIDDTLVHKELHLAENTREVIRKLKDAGVMFTLATGRMPYRAEVFANEAELTVPYIANNGSILYDNGTYVYAKKVYAGIFKDLFREYMERDPEFTVGDTDDVWDQMVHKVYIVDDGRTGIIGEIADRLRAMNGEYSFFQYQQFSMEIVAPGCSKASGLRTLLDYLKVAPEEVMAIGDHTNDMEVISMVGMGVAVANAQEKVKAIADYVTEKERAEGVEEAIRRFALP